MKKALEITGYISFDKKSNKYKEALRVCFEEQGMGSLDIADVLCGKKVKFKFSMPHQLGALNNLWSNFK